MLSYRLLFFILCAVCLVGIRTHAQEVTFNASVENTTVTEGQQFQVTYTLSGGDLRNYSNFSQPNLNQDFLTLAGPSTSQQMSIINGKVSASISWIYVLQPRAKGTYTIPAATLNYDGSTLRSNEIRIKVVAGGGGQSNGNSSRQSNNADDVDLGTDLMLKAIPDKRDVYLGEPVRVTYKLFSRVDFQLENIVKIPRSVGFWSEELEAPRRLQPKIEVYNGKQYQTFLVRKVVYFPTQTGELFIEPFEISAVVAVRVKRSSGDSWRDRFFSDPFFDSYKNVRKAIASSKIGINVKDLPEDGKPESFGGAVGDYTMQVGVDRSELKANETMNLTVSIAGTGNIKLLNEPNVIVPSGVDRYEPNISEDYSPESGSITGKKTFEYVLIPRYPGKLTIPPVEFSYFDLDKKKFVTLKSEAFDLSVGEGDAISEENQPHSQRIKYLAMDIKPLKTNLNELETSDTGRLNPGLMVSMYAVPLILMFVGIAWKKRYDRIHGDRAGLLMRRANRTAEKHLSASKKYLSKGETDNYYLEIAKALWGYLQHKLSISNTDVSIMKVLQVLEDNQVSAEARAHVDSALQGIEFARFSPSRGQMGEKTALYESARTAIISIEQELRA